MSETPAPFFVVGSQRSGTTMLRLMLNQHSRLAVPFESAFIPEFFYRRHEFGDLSRAENVAAMLDEIAQRPLVAKGRLISDREGVLRRNPADYRALVDAIFTEWAHQRGKVRWGDKTPFYVEEIDTLRALFPQCKFIHLIRDGRDVAVSLRTLSWGSRDLIKLANDWRWNVMLGRKMGNLIPDHYLEVHYEALVSNPVESLRRICSFLAEPFEHRMLQYHEHAVTEMPAASMQWHKWSVRAPHPGKAQAWRTSMSSADRIVFERIAGDALTLFGYETGELAPTFKSRLQFARYSLFGHA